MVYSWKQRERDFNESQGHKKRLSKKSSKDNLNRKLYRELPPESRPKSKNFKDQSNDDFYLKKDRILAMIDSLKTSIDSGFRLRSSPVGPMLQSLIDLCLQISLFFSEGGWFEDRKYPGLRFGTSYTDKNDVKHADSSPLGNPRSIKINIPGQFLHPDEYLSDWFGDIAACVASIFLGNYNPKEFSKLRRYSPRRDKKKHKTKDPVADFFYQHRKRHLKGK